MHSHSQRTELSLSHNIQVNESIKEETQSNARGQALVNYSNQSKEVVWLLLPALNEEEAMDYHTRGDHGGIGEECDGVG